MCVEQYGRGTFLVHCHGETIAWADSREFVMGCPCNGMRPYQDFIDSHAEQIAEYLNARAKQLAEHAEKMKVQPNERIRS